jgi:glyoxylase-like metal-dependent hydrolase (beta-lactamase superfamily II)
LKRELAEYTGRTGMKILEHLHAFLWNSMSANNCNTYLIDGPARLVIDPGHLGLFGHVEVGLRQLGIGIADIDLVIATHCHPDHLEAVKLFKDHPASFGVHEKDWYLIREMGRHLGASLDTDAYAPAFFLQEGNLVVKGMEFQVFHSPGHSPGSICLYWPDQKALFTGDVVFRDGLGRTDLPGGNGTALKKSIQRLAELEVERILPGHGDVILGADQVRMNFERIERSWFAYI